jgi:hypothetical protein
VHEIKHDGYRLMARRDPIGIRLITRKGYDWSPRYPLIVEAVTQTPPGCSRERMRTNCRRAPRLWHFLQLRPRQPMPPSPFELGLGLVERRRMVIRVHLRWLADHPVQRPDCSTANVQGATPIR